MTINYFNIYDIHNYVTQFPFSIIECVPEDICLPSAERKTEEKSEEILQEFPV